MLGNWGKLYIRMLECLRKSEGGILIDIKVVSNSKKEGFNYDKFGKRIKIRIKDIPEDGKANKSIIRNFSELFGNCEIISGNLSKKKTLLVKNLKIGDIDRILWHNLEFLKN